MDKRVTTVVQESSLDADPGVEFDSSVWARLWDSLRRDRPALIGALIVLVFVVLAVFAPALAPHDPNMQFANGISDAGAPLPPTHEFPFGTDDLGRDLL